MSFSQEMKDFVAAFSAGSEVVHKSQNLQMQREMMRARIDYMNAKAEKFGQPKMNGADRAYQQGHDSWGGGDTTSTPSGGVSLSGNEPSGGEWDHDGSNVKVAYDTLTSLGVPQKTAYGALGSLGWEAGPTLRANAKNAGDGSDGSDSIGWGQWNGIRGQNLRKTAAELGVPWTDPRANALHLKRELTGYYGKGDDYSFVLQKLKGADDITHGANVWTNDYEVPKVRNVDQRAQRGAFMAKKYLASYGGGAMAQAVNATPAAAPTAAPTQAVDTGDEGGGIRDNTDSENAAAQQSQAYDPEEQAVLSDYGSAY